ncbi:rcc01693 family protein [Segnochrobactrum spirostomi]
MTRPPAAMPWDDLIAFGLGVLKLAPEAFWRMTPRELAAVLAPRRTAGPDRRALDTLMARFPDRST